LISDGILQLGDGSTSGSISTTGGALITNNSVLVLNPSPAGASVANSITGTGSIIKIGSGTNTFTGANSYSGSTTISNGILSINSSSTLGDGTGTLNLAGGTLSSTASRTASSAPVANPVNLTADSAITTISTSATVDFNLNSDSIGGSAGTLTFSNAAPSGTGVFQPRFSGSSFNFSRPIVIANGSFGTTRLDSYNTNGTLQTFSSVISGTGGYRRNASTASLAGTTIFIADNLYTGLTEVNRGTLLVNGSLAAASSVTVGGSSQNGTLGGNGVIKGPVSVLINGTLSPGGSIGILTISNSLTFASGSACFMELNKSTPTNDLARGITTVIYAGTLTVTNLAGTLALNDTFKLFDATSYSGSFSATNLPALDPGLAWDVTGLTNNGTIKIVAAVVSSPTLNYAQTNNVSTFSWTGGFKLQSQTNLLTVGLVTNSSAWFDYPGGGTSPVAVTNDPASPSVFFRLISTP
jgi:autotransporter-associated beta strand protein